MNISVADAKNKLTQLLQLVERGERVTICRHGQPVVDLVLRRAKERRGRVFGAQRGIIVDPIGQSLKTMSSPGFKGDM